MNTADRNNNNNQNGKPSEDATLQATMNNVMQASSKEATNQLLNSSTSHEIRGYDLNRGVDYPSIFASYMTTGFQATNFAKAVNEINRMVSFADSALL